MKPIASEVAENVEQPVVMNQETEEIIDYSNKGLKELVDLFQELLDKGDVQQLYKYAEGIKAAFYKTLKKEKIAAGFQPAVTAVAQQAEQAAEAAADAVETAVEAAADAEQAAAAEVVAPQEGEEVSANPFAELERGFKDLYGQYKTVRVKYVQELNQKKEENYEAKSKIIDELKVLVENPGDLGTAYPAFRELQNRWRAAGAVPPTKAKDLYETYSHYVEAFYDYVKINRELRDLDFKKNLEAKEKLCERAEALADSDNAVAAFREIQKLHDEWKEFGPVDKAHRESIWERFKAATSVVNKKHQAYFESQKGNQQQNLEAKTALCEKVEEIAAREVKDSNTWNALSKEIENIQKEWRTIGFASKKENQKIYERFRAACDKFYASKRDFYSGFKDQMQENMDKKVALCEQAEAVINSTEWKKTSDYLISLQKQWKEIGPVSRKKSEQIWKRFRAACDAFFENRDKHFSDQDSKYDDNLAAKNAVIDEINAYELAGTDADKDALAAFQARWNEIGFVPLKDKATVQNAYNKALSD
ncbi:MAG: DUF349 domain-containing protein, partial [Bacteroidales bacterium]|nr:DUF349 domain-containing protein [Bacteroidales bacterium]